MLQSGRRGLGEGMWTRLLGRHPVASFLILAFLISHGLNILAQLFVAMLGLRSGGFLQAQFFTLIVVSGPALAAVIVTRAAGRGSVAAWLASDWRRTMPRWWWLLVPAATLAVTIIAYRVAGAAWSELREMLFGDWAMLIAYLAIHILMVALLEETGWRGWLLRNRLVGNSPLRSTLFVALVWVLWHLPKMLGDWRFALIFAVAVLANSILLTACWARLRGGIALAAIAHGSFNAPFYFFGDLSARVDAVTAFGAATIIYATFALLLVALDRTWWRNAPVPARLGA